MEVEKVRISVAEIEHVAALARLKLSPEEKESLTREMDAILGHVARLAELDTAGASPTSHAVSLTNVFREDRVGETLSQEEALANAPDRVGGLFRVPKIID